MDFKQLMDLASQNKTRIKKQETKDATARNCDSKSNKSGVSDEAVKAFLAKRELEMKRKAEEEKAARRAKIEERLAKSLGKESAKNATCSQRQKKSSDSDVTARKHPDNKNEKQKVSERKDSKTTCQTSSKKPDRTRHSLEPVAKNPDSNSKKSFSKGQGSIKRGAPMDFKALLAVAEKNKNGGAKLPPVFEHGRSVKQGGREVEGGGAKNGSLEKSKVVNRGQGKTVKDGKTTGQMHEKRSSKLQAKEVADKALSSVRDSKSRQDLKRSKELVSASREKGLALKASSSVNQGKLSSSKVVHPNNDRWPVKEGQHGKRRERDTLKRKRNPYMEDLDDMDDFIDDGDGDEVDVSKYIREIFNYDKSRFHDDGDDDLAGMESSYKQIEKEEVKSAKIARLEDEIEQLKELHDLKKQRDKLKKKAKK